MDSVLFHLNFLTQFCLCRHGKCYNSAISQASPGGKLLDCVLCTYYMYIQFSEGIIPTPGNSSLSYSAHLS